MEVPKGAGGLPPEISRSIHIGRFSSGGLMEVPKGAGGEIGRDNPPQLMQSIMPALPVPTSRSGGDETMADISAAVRELRQEFRRRPSPIIMDQRGNILSMEQEKERMRRERL